MKKIPITLTLPENLVRDLHLYLSKGQISKFVSEMVEKGLSAEKERIAREFQESSRDSERNTEVEMWDTLIEDGLDATNSY